MPNWLTITWENDRLMLLTARGQGTSTTVERLAVLRINEYGSEHGESPHRPVPLKKQLEEYIRKHKLGKSETVVLLSRSDVEVRPMLFPPVPTDELPDLVKFQATKEFNGYDPSSPLDFFITNKLEHVSRSTLFPAIRTNGKPLNVKALQQSSGTPKHVLASTIRNDVFRKIQGNCDELGLTLRHVLLRPCETAFLYRQSSRFQPDRTTLLVELDTSETSQTVLFQGEPVFMRSPKISCPEDVGNPDFAARLIAELKRTRIAVRNEIQGVTVDDVVFCGVGKHFDSLAAQVSEGLGVSARTFDPWEGVLRSGDLKQDSVFSGIEQSERFAPLLGAIRRIGKNESADIDFCHPKKRSEPMGQRQLFSAVLATIFVLIVSAVGYGFYAKHALTREVRELSQKRATLDKTARTVGGERVQLKAIDDWLSDDVNWFEELGWLSRRAPEAKDMMITDLTMSANQQGSIALKTLVRDSSVVSPMEDRFRVDNHEVKTAEKSEVKGNLQYGFRFNLTISLSKGAGAVAVPTEASTETPTVTSTVTPNTEEEETSELPATPAASPVEASGAVKSTVPSESQRNDNAVSSEQGVREELSEKPTAESNGGKEER